MIPASLFIYHIWSSRFLSISFSYANMAGLNLQRKQRRGRKVISLPLGKMVISPLNIVY
jgi:hypothetical protein